jgi:hypothetical protein
MLKILVPIAFVLPAILAQAVPSVTPALTLEQQEEFLKKAVVKSTRGSKKGVTGTTRATMSDGTVTHDASIQTIDENKAKFETPAGTEFNFQDSYKLNLAAYHLGKKLGLGGMIPPSVERYWNGKPASFTWWVDDVQMDEADRLKKKMEAPDKDKWSRQYLIMRVFDQLIYNVDRNATNMLYDKDWKLWMIDTSRAFRRHAKLQDAKALDKCDGALLARMKELTEAELRKDLGRWLDTGQIRSVLARRDLIVAHFEKAGPSKLYEYLPAK